MGAVITAQTLRGSYEDEWENVYKVLNPHLLPLPNISHANLSKKFRTCCPVLGNFLTSSIFLIEEWRHVFLSFNN